MPPVGSGHRRPSINDGTFLQGTLTMEFNDWMKFKSLNPTISPLKLPIVRKMGYCNLEDARNPELPNDLFVKPRPREGFGEASVSPTPCPGLC